MGTIINLDSYRSKSYPAICMDNSVPAKKIPTVEELELYVNYQEQFSIDLKNLKYQTRNHKFMFPTILHRYKRTINPVSALYNTIQEVMINYDHTNKTHVWLMGLFENSEWLCDLINSLDNDIDSINTTIDRYKNTNSTYIGKQIKLLEKTAERFHYYKIVFISIPDWIRDNQ